MGAEVGAGGGGGAARGGGLGGNTSDGSKVNSRSAEAGRLSSLTQWSSANEAGKFGRGMDRLRRNVVCASVSARIASFTICAHAMSTVVSGSGGAVDSP